MGLHEVVLDFTLRTTVGIALVLAIILVCCFGIPRRSKQTLTRPDVRKLG
ncbi:MAG TPA: hypothetical protein VH596_01365 [Terriglobales bacterium]|jgi:hypothetical protein